MDSTIYLYGDVGYEVTAGKVAAFLDAADGDITVRVSSNGGDAYEGVAITSLLRSYNRGHVTIIVDGIAASAASVIAVGGGDTLIMAEGAELMIHSAWSSVTGNAAELTAHANNLERFSRTIAGFYARATGISVDEWMALMEKETWYTADEAVAAGLADEVLRSSFANATIDTPAYDSPQNRGITRVYASRMDAPAPPLEEIKEKIMTSQLLTRIANMLGITSSDELDEAAVMSKLEAVLNKEEPQEETPEETPAEPVEESQEEPAGFEEPAEEPADDAENDASDDSNEDDEDSAEEEALEDDASDDSDEDDSEEEEEEAPEAEPLVTNCITLDKDVYQDLLERASMGDKAFANQKRQEAEDLIDGAIKAGKVLSAKRDALVEAAINDYSAMSAHLDSLASGVIPVAEKGRGMVTDSEKNTASAEIDEKIHKMFSIR